MASLSPDTIREALRLARGAGAGEIELRAGDDAFSASFAPTAAPAALAVAEDAPKASGPTLLRSTHVGYFHPTEPPLVAGSAVKAGAVIGIVESLGLANDVAVSEGGTFAGYLVEDGAPVEFGQALAEVTR